MPLEQVGPPWAGTREPAKIAVGQFLIIFVPSRLRLRVDALLGDPRCDRLERRALRQQRLGLGSIPAGVALRALCVELAVFDHVRGRNERRRADIDAADMTEQEIPRIDRLTAHFGVEIEAAWREAPRLQDE